MLSVQSLDDTMGAAFVGVSTAVFLLGLCCAQAFTYFTQQNDPRVVRYMIGGLLLLNCVHQGLIMHSVYYYLVLHFNDEVFLDSIVWSLTVEGLFNGLIALCVQSFWIWRISRLAKYRLCITLLLEIIAVAQAGCVIAFVTIAFTTVETFSRMEPKLRELSAVVNVIATIDDVIIACVLSFLFQSSKNGFRSTSNISNRLTLHAVNTGAITSICAMSTLVSMLAAPKTLIYIAFYFCIGQLYTASLLATLNARNGMRNAADDTQTASGRMSPLMFKSFANERVINKSIFNNQSDIAVDAIDGTQLEMETDFMNRTPMYELYDTSSDTICQKLPRVPQQAHFNAI